MDQGYVYHYDYDKRNMRLNINTLTKEESENAPYHWGSQVEYDIKRMQEIVDMARKDGLIVEGWDS